MTYGLLHISDLHRSPTDPIGNPELLSTLLADRDRIVEIGSPEIEIDAVIVSGDLVQGVALGRAGYENELDEQYATAEAFLIEVADAYLDGDRSRMVIVPGNHDVDWNRSLSGMTPVGEADVPGRFSLEMCGPSADLRWDWRERRVYQIIDRELYDQRLSRFDALIERFYAGTGVVQEPLYRLHSLADERIAVLAFNSCEGNDCFAYHGQIAEDAVANAHLALRDKPFELYIAVWHHSIDGEPTQSDYMSGSIVEAMIGRGFRLGLHGHQHHARAATRYIHLPAEEKMAVVSSGSLCAGANELPAGVNRQYNIIRIAEDLCSARVFPREMVIGTTFSETRRPEFGLEANITLDWELPLGYARRREEHEAALTIEAEELIHQGDFAHAAEILRSIETPEGSYSRGLLLQAFEAQESWVELLTAIGEPSVVADLVRAVGAAIEAGELERAKELLDDHGSSLGLPEGQKSDLEGRINAMRTLG